MAVQLWLEGAETLSHRVKDTWREKPWSEVHVSAGAPLVQAVPRNTQNPDIELCVPESVTRVRVGVGDRPEALPDATMAAWELPPLEKHPSPAPAEEPRSSRTPEAASPERRDEEEAPAATSSGVETSGDGSIGSVVGGVLGGALGGAPGDVPILWRAAHPTEGEVALKTVHVPRPGMLASIRGEILSSPASTRGGGRQEWRHPRLGDHPEHEGVFGDSTSATGS